MPYKDRGKWRGVVTLKGKRYTEARQEWTKKDATKWEIEKRRELMTEQTGMGYRAFSVKYLDHAQAMNMAKTYKGKLATVKRFGKYLGSDIPVEGITPAMASEYLMLQAQARSNNASNADRKNLIAMWSWGIRILDVHSNPFAKTEPYRHDRTRQYVPPEKDILKIKAVATPIEKAFLDCYLCTAARRCEIMRLTWDDVNFEARTVALTTNKMKGETKRTILPMNDTLYSSLMWHWKSRENKESPYVWVNPSRLGAGGPYSVRRKFLSSLCKRAGVRSFGYHSLRRYVATMLSDQHKIGTKTIQRILGHSSERMTEVYLYNAHQDLADVMSLLDGGESKVKEKENTTQNTTDARKPLPRIV